MRCDLIRNGVPYDLAMVMETWKVLAHSVVFGTLSGGTFDWDRMQWRRKT